METCRPSCHHLVLEVGDAGGLDRAELLELNAGGPEVVEQASAVAEEYWDDVELDLVQQPRRQVLVHDLGAAPEHDVLAAGGVSCLSERGLDSIRDEVIGGPFPHL